MGMDELNAKLRYIFVVREDVVLYQEVARLPRFISEYLISSLGKEKPDREDLEKISRVTSECYPEPRDRDKVLHPKTGQAQPQVSEVHVRIRQGERYERCRHGLQLRHHDKR